jgi:hypothetical protein
MVAIIPSGISSNASNSGTNTTTPVEPGLTFTFPFAPVPTTAFSVGTVINVTVTNNYASQLTAVVFAAVYNAAGQTALITSGALTLASGATGSAYPVLTGLAHGTYTVAVFVLSMSDASLSPTYTISIIV